MKKEKLGRGFFFRFYPRMCELLQQHAPFFGPGRGGGRRKGKKKSWPRDPCTPAEPPNFTSNFPIRPQKKASSVQPHFVLTPPFSNQPVTTTSPAFPTACETTRPTHPQHCLGPCRTPPRRIFTAGPHQTGHAPILSSPQSPACSQWGSYPGSGAAKGQSPPTSQVRPELLRRAPCAVQAPDPCGRALYRVQTVEKEPFLGVVERREAPTLNPASSSLFCGFREGKMEITKPLCKNMRHMKKNEKRKARARIFFSFLSQDV